MSEAHTQFIERLQFYLNRPDTDFPQTPIPPNRSHFKYRSFHGNHLRKIFIAKEIWTNPMYAQEKEALLSFMVYAVEAFKQKEPMFLQLSQNATRHRKAVRNELIIHIGVALIIQYIEIDVPLYNIDVNPALNRVNDIRQNLIQKFMLVLSSNGNYEDTAREISNMESQIIDQLNEKKREEREHFLQNMQNISLGIFSTRTPPPGSEATFDALRRQDIQQLIANIALHGKIL